MLGHYLTVTLRNLGRHRLHTAVSVLVLMLGLTCFLAAYLAVSYLTNYDRRFANADRSYVVFQGMHGSKISFDWPSYPFSSVLLAAQLEADVPELEAVARYRALGNLTVTVDSELKPRRMAVAEPGLLAIFGFDVVAGDLRDALVGRNAIVTAGAAQALFGTTNVVGKTMTMRERQSIDVTLVAVIADPPVASTSARADCGRRGSTCCSPGTRSTRCRRRRAAAGTTRRSRRSRSRRPIARCRPRTSTDAWRSS